MPCTCWYDPPEESKKLIKDACQSIVDEIKKCEKHADPMGIGINQTKQLLDHLYTGKCLEKDDYAR
jgi:hypothetical protein